MPPLSITPGTVTIARDAAAVAEYVHEVRIGQRSDKVAELSRSTIHQLIVHTPATAEERIDFAGSNAPADGIGNNGGLDSWLAHHLGAQAIDVLFVQPPAVTAALLGRDEPDNGPPSVEPVQRLAERLAPVAVATGCAVVVVWPS